MRFRNGTDAPAFDRVRRFPARIGAPSCWTSGRFAMVDNGLGFALVPWRPAVEKALA
ncbi:MAG TPA: DUF3363 domain-containing protein [Casimicrobiaceae bacterium]|nr:DUF3363 domain-containing protein [Casimicrobiaceae bacterium]